MTQLHAEGNAFGEASELFAHRLAHRLERLEPRAALRIPGEADRRSGLMAITIPR